MNFFSKISKHKKVLIFSFLFIILLFPQITHASSWVSTAVDYYFGNGITTDTGTCINNLSFFQSIEGGLADIIMIGPKIIAGITTKLSGFIISTVLDWPITNSGDGAAQAFAKGWQSTRNLANMLIVLGFVVIGIATALRIREYEAKNFLGKLIIIALLINFSGLFCGLIIDSSKITMNWLISQGSTASNMGTIFFTDIEKIQQTTGCDALKNADIGKYVANNVMFGFIYLTVAFAFLYLSIILLARYAVLGILFILSPLAFVFYAFPFPKAKDLWNKWWEAFLKWSFIGVSICFFLWLANQILSGFTVLQSVNSNSNVSDVMQYLFVVLMIMVVGIYISSKSSGIGSFAAGAVMGVATGGAGLALGAVAGAGKLGGGALNKLTGGAGSAASQKISTWAGRGAEFMGARPIGSTASANAKEVESQAGLMSKEYAAAKATGNTRSINRIQQLAKSGRGAQGAAAMKTITDAKDLSDVFTPPGGTMDLAQTAQRLQYAEKSGAVGNITAAEKLDPRLRGHNQAAVDKMMMPVASGGKGIASDAVARQTLVNEGFQKANVSDIRNFSPDILKSKQFRENIPGNKIEFSSREMSAGQIEAIKSNVPEMRKEAETRMGLNTGWEGMFTDDEKNQLRKEHMDNLYNLAPGWDNGLSDTAKEAAKETALKSLRPDQQKEITDIQNILKKINTINGI